MAFTAYQPNKISARRKRLTKKFPIRMITLMALSRFIAMETKQSKRKEKP